jgi:hypothetical protein
LTWIESNKSGSRWQGFKRGKQGLPSPLGCAHQLQLLLLLLLLLQASCPQPAQHVQKINPRHVQQQPRPVVTTRRPWTHQVWHHVVIVTRLVRKIVRKIVLGHDVDRTGRSPISACH